MQMPAGVGLGLRRELLAPLSAAKPDVISFFEVAPENWLPFGGALGKQFRRFTEQYPFVCHGLSLSLGGPDPLDLDFLAALKRFFQQHQIKVYSEHLSFCSAGGHLYDLLPIPFTSAAARYVAARIRQVQDILQCPLVIENVSYYATPGQDMSELDFTLEVLQQADCGLLLDVNNVYVNATNHGYDPRAFIAALPSERIVYGHIAGHYQNKQVGQPPLIDTHGSQVSADVWQLLAFAYQQHGVFPTLLERDFHLPPLSELTTELAMISTLQQQASAQPRARITEPAVAAIAVPGGY
jgi:uncharacterized protein (UPF0276 family)